MTEVYWTTTNCLQVALLVLLAFEVIVSNRYPLGP